MKYKLLVLGLSLFLVGCSNNNSDKNVNESSSDSIEFKSKLATSSESIQKITYKDSSDNDFNEILKFIGDEGIEIFYNKELGYFNYQENPGTINEMYGEGSSGISFALSKEKGNSVDVSIFKLSDDNAYNELKDRYDNPEQTSYDNKLVITGKYEFNNDKKIFVSASDSTEDSESIDKIMNYILNLK